MHNVSWLLNCLPNSRFTTLLITLNLTSTRVRPVLIVSIMMVIMSVTTLMSANPIPVRRIKNALIKWVAMFVKWLIHVSRNHAQLASNAQSVVGPLPALIWTSVRMIHAGIISFVAIQLDHTHARPLTTVSRSRATLGTRVRIMLKLKVDSAALISTSVKMDNNVSPVTAVTIFWGRLSV